MATVGIKLPKPRIYKLERNALKRRDFLAAQWPDKGEFFVAPAGFGRRPFDWCVFLKTTTPNGATATLPCA